MQSIGFQLSIGWAPDTTQAFAHSSNCPCLQWSLLSSPYCPFAFCVFKRGHCGAQCYCRTVAWFPSVSSHPLQQLCFAACVLLCPFSALISCPLHPPLASVLSPSPACLTYQCFWCVFRDLKPNYTLVWGKIGFLYFSPQGPARVSEYGLTSEGKAVRVAWKKQQFIKFYVSG